MHPEFWLTRWVRGEIGFHREDINPWLIQYWPSLALPAGTRTLVPLCGKSRDMLWLREQGHEVVGVELSAQAVEDFFREAGLLPARSREGAFQRYFVEGIEILCGDFFDLTAADLPNVTAVYDRASLIALPPDLRFRYVRHLRSLLPQGAECLLVTMDYPQQEMQGPPFAVAGAEVQALYDGMASVQQLACHDVLEENPRFRQRGMTRMHEHIYRLIFDKP